MIVGVFDYFGLIVVAATHARETDTAIASPIQTSVLRLDKNGKLDVPLTLAHGGAARTAQIAVLALRAAIVGRYLARLAIHLRYLIRTLHAIHIAVGSVARDAGGQVASLLSRVFLIRGCHAWSWRKTVVCLLVDLIHSPHHGSSKASLVCEITLLLERVVIVVADPLGAVPCDPLDTGFLIPGWLDLLFRYNAFNLLEA